MEDKVYDDEITPEDQGRIDKELIEKQKKEEKANRAQIREKINQIKENLTEKRKMIGHKNPKEEEEEENGTAIFYEGPLFAQVPIELAHDPKMKLAAKGMYAIYHGLCRTKTLEKIPFVFITQKKLSKKYVGMSEVSIRHWTNELKGAG